MISGWTGGVASRIETSALVPIPRGATPGMRHLPGRRGEPPLESP